METRANYVLIGLFTLLVVASALGFVYWFAQYGDSRESREIDVLFQGAVTGLSNGSSVMYNGIRIGEVSRLRLDPNDPGKVIGRVRVDAAAPIKTDTKVQLEYQGITGVGAVQLSGGTPGAPSLFVESEDVPTMVAERSAYEDIIEGARDIMGQADGVLRRFDTLLAANEAAISATVQNAETLTRNLAEGSDDLGQLMSSAGQFSEAFSNLSANLEGTIENLERLVAAVEPETVQRTLANVERFSADLADSSAEVKGMIAQSAGEVQGVIADARRATGQVNRILEGASELPQTFRTVMDGAQVLITDLDRVAKAVDPERVQRTVANLEELVASVEPEAVQRTLANVETFSSSLAASSEEVTAIIADARRATGQVNRILAGADGLPETLKTVAAAAQTLITDLNRVTAAVDPERVQRTVANAESFSNSLAASTDEVDRIVADAGQLATKLNAMADRVDGVIAKVDGYLEGESGQGLIQEATLAAQSFRRLSEQLESRVDVVASDISNFTDSGLRNLEGFVSDGRRTLDNLNRLISTVERNPSGFIFGGGNRVPEYRGR